MSIIDAAIALILLISLMTGFSRGIFRLIFSYIRFILSIILTKLTVNLAKEKLLLLKPVQIAVSWIVSALSDLVKIDFIKNYVSGSAATEYAALFLLVFIAINLILYIFMKLGSSKIKSSKFYKFDKLLGALLSVTVSAAVMMGVIYLFDKIPDSLISLNTKDMLSGSLFVKYLYIYNIFFNIYG